MHTKQDSQQQQPKKKKKSHRDKIIIIFVYIFNEPPSFLDILIMHKLT